MALWYILGRIGMQLGVLFLGVVLYSPWTEQSGVMNAFMYTFFAASIPPVWRRNIELKIRLAALGVGAIVATPFGAIYLEVMNSGPYANPGFVAILVSGLVFIVGPATGWFTSIGTISWMLKRTTLHSRGTGRHKQSVGLLVPLNRAQPTLVTASKEIIAFRFLLLIWGVGLLIFCFAVFSYFKAADEQKLVEYFLSKVEECAHMQNKSSVHNFITNCYDVTVPGYAQGEDDAAQMKYLWAGRAENSFYLAIVVLVLSSLIFYGIRWSITGRLRPLWPLQRRARNAPKTRNSS